MVDREPLLNADCESSANAAGELDLLQDLGLYERQLRFARLLISVSGAIAIAVLLGSLFHGASIRTACLEALQQHGQMNAEEIDRQLSHWSKIELIGFVSTVVAVLVLAIPLQIGLVRAFNGLQSSLKRSICMAHVVRNMSDAVALLDVHGRIVWVNAGYESLSGYPAKEVCGSAWLTWMVKDSDSNDSFERFCEAIATGTSIQAEMLRRHRRGSAYFVRAEILPIFDPGQGLLGFQAIETNLSKYAAAQDKRRHSDEFKQNRRSVEGESSAAIADPVGYSDTVGYFGAAV